MCQLGGFVEVVSVGALADDVRTFHQANAELSTLNHATWWLGADPQSGRDKAAPEQGSSSILVRGRYWASGCTSSVEISPEYE